MEKGVAFSAVQHKSWTVWAHGRPRARQSTESTANSAQSEQSNSQSSDSAPSPPSFESKLRRFLVPSLVGLVTITFLYGRLVEMKTNALIPTGTPSVDMAEFVKKYLSVGEVKMITIFDGGERALATLHAVIDGKLTRMPFVSIEFAFGYEQQFVAKVRKEEEKLGIFFSERVPIEVIPAIVYNFMRSDLAYVGNCQRILEQLSEEAAKKG